jgi:hypothetical protein
MRAWMALLATLLLASCATGRYQWSIAHLSVSPRAKKLPQSELEEIVKLVVNASSSTVIAVGLPCDGTPGVIHVVVDYTPDRFMVYDVKKIGGHWKIAAHRDASPTITELFDVC